MAKAGRPKDPNSKRASLHLRVNEVDLANWNKAWVKVGAESLTAWIEGQLNSAAKRALRK